MNRPARPAPRRQTTCRTAILRAPPGCKARSTTSIRLQPRCNDERNRSGLHTCVRRARRSGNLRAAENNDSDQRTSGNPFQPADAAGRGRGRPSGTCHQPSFKLAHDQRSYRFGFGGAGAARCVCEQDRRRDGRRAAADHQRDDVDLVCRDDRASFSRAALGIQQSILGCRDDADRSETGDGNRRGALAGYLRATVVAARGSFRSPGGTTAR